jgi:AcrR family transcriptional regulator
MSVMRTAVAGRPTADEAFRLARRIWYAGGRVDMSALAIELGVGRQTLYRWLGSREKLLVEVVWSMGRKLLDHVEARVHTTGGDRIADVIVGFLDGVIRSPAMRTWLRDEGEYAMRLLTRHDTGFQPRLIGAVHELLEREHAAGALNLPVDSRELAYVIVRLIESYTYLDLITGEEPDARRAEPILRMLLR